MLFYECKRNIALFRRVIVKHLFAGALALSLLVAGAASAQYVQPRPDQPGYQQNQGYQQDQRPGYDRGQQYQDNRDHRGGDQMGDRRDGGRGYDRYRHADGRRSCYWRHHQRVCHWYR